MDPLAVLFVIYMTGFLSFGVTMPVIVGIASEDPDISLTGDQIALLSTLCVFLWPLTFLICGWIVYTSSYPETVGK